MNRIASNQFSSLRKSAQLSIEDVADFLRVSLSEVEALENGTKSPSVSNLLALEGLQFGQPNRDVDEQNEKVEFQTIGEMFSGPGGGGIGASQSKLKLEDKTIKIRHTWATDYDRDTCDTYLNNISKYEAENLGINEPVKVICDDINNIDLSRNGPFEKVDGLLFGFPCNDYSIVGESKGINGTFGPLYKHGITILNRPDKPKWFMAENVGGITSSNDGNAFAQILFEMKDAGYNIVAHKYKFEEYSVPQARHRVIIVGIQTSLDKNFRVPVPHNKKITAGEALANIPKTATHQILTNQSRTVIERLKRIKPGKNVWNSDLPDHLKLNVRNTKLSHIYRRLEKDKPAYTLTGSGGGGTHMYHWEEPRALTNRERARIQTFPDWFNFSGKKESIRKQIGMAIPPQGAKVVIEAILSTLYDVNYNSIEPNIDVEKVIQSKKFA